jgi:hypothetical protein
MARPSLREAAAGRTSRTGAEPGQTPTAGSPVTAPLTRARLCFQRASVDAVARALRGHATLPRVMGCRRLRSGMSPQERFPGAREHLYRPSRPKRAPTLSGAAARWNPQALRSLVRGVPLAVVVGRRSGRSRKSRAGPPACGRPPGRPSGHLFKGAVRALLGGCRRGRKRNWGAAPGLRPAPWPPLRMHLQRSGQGSSWGLQERQKAQPGCSPGLRLAPSPAFRLRRQRAGSPRLFGPPWPGSRCAAATGGRWSARLEVGDFRPIRSTPAKPTIPWKRTQAPG